jgi:hypothetical protein
LLTLPFRAFDAAAALLVSPPVDYRPTRDELRRQRDVLMEELEKPQAGGMGGG